MPSNLLIGWLCIGFGLAVVIGAWASGLSGGRLSDAEVEQRFGPIAERMGRVRR